MSKNVLVTGGNGFIGSHVVDFLVKKKYNVTTFDLSPPIRKNVKFIRGSILDKNCLQFALKNIDFVFHLAAVSDIKKVKSIPIKTIPTNILGTTYLLEASRNKNVKRFIFASSVYSFGTTGNLYTTSKISSELLIKNYKLLFGQNFTILRYSTAYGPRSREVDAVSIFVERALKNLDIVIFGDGQQKRNYLHVEDLAKGSMMALKQKTKNKIITLASKNNIKMFDLARTIIRLTKSSSKIRFNKKNKRFDDFTSNYSYKNNNEDIINWKPKYSLKKGLEQYIGFKRNF
jgi:UDP-glucose 4-epimerase